jgi:hypothetical protein
MRSSLKRFAVVASFVASFVAPFVSTIAAAQTIPSRLSDKELWQLNADYSEANGYFRSDNFLSNETGFQYVIPALKQRIAPGSVYLGVGPEQNFTYIVALQPRIAFIFDIRRGNMIAHLMYKALFETSPDRAEFLSKLFSRPRPPGLDANSTPEQLFAAYTAAPRDSALFRRNLAAVKSYLTRTHGWVMNDSDSKLMDFTYGAFFGGGPEINYNYPNTSFRGFGRGGMPNYATLQQATDSSGKNWAYLATEANYRWIKDFESKNLLVPVVSISRIITRPSARSIRRTWSSISSRTMSGRTTTATSPRCRSIPRARSFDRSAADFGAATRRARSCRIGWAAACRR